jgi:cation diffusion facilitator family transporter
MALMALKLGVALHTGSTAILSDALESMVNVVASVVSLVLTRLARRPPDRTHPYGHGKAEYFASSLEGFLIGMAGLFILKEATARLVHPEALHALVGSTLLLVAALLWMTVLGLYLRRKGVQLHSVALRAEGTHWLTDAQTTGAVLLGLWVVQFTGWLRLDPVIALFVAAHIFWNGWKLIQESVGVLMDQAIPEEELQRILHLLQQVDERILGAHNLKTRRIGPTLFVDFDLVVDGRESVEVAHRLAHTVDQRLKETFGQVVTHIHIEPGEPHRLGFFPDRETDRSMPPPPPEAPQQPSA